MAFPEANGGCLKFATMLFAPQPFPPSPHMAFSKSKKQGLSITRDENASSCIESPAMHYAPRTSHGAPASCHQVVNYSPEKHGHPKLNAYFLRKYLTKEGPSDSIIAP
ncbi:MAG: hypothetical protein JRI89_14920 [Deltaproteobacteria bacterium]|nr:hypothetical protein [Deltaproteobacteria bacterium]